MQDHPSVEALRSEWAELFERVLACGAQTGAMAALDGLVQSAKASMNASVREGSFDRHNLPTIPKRSRLGVPARKRDGTRAPSGSVQRLIRSILEKSLPLRVHQIIEEAARTERGHFKDTSVRVALATMRKNGEAQQNDIGEWSLTPQSGSKLSSVPSEEGHTAYREAA